VNATHHTRLLVGAVKKQSQQVHSQTEPKIATPDVDIPVHPPRTGVISAPGVRGLGVEEVAVFEDSIFVLVSSVGCKL